MTGKAAGITAKTALVIPLHTQYPRARIFHRIMKLRPFLVTPIVVAAVTFAFAADDDNPIKQAMNFAHKAPRGEKKLNEKIADGSAPEADIQKALDLYKAMADTKPPKGDAAAFKEKTNKLIAATEEVIAKNPDGIEHYKSAVDCKACHSEHRKMPPGGPGGFGPGGPGGRGPEGPGGPPPPPK
jgi:cytochrome c556